MKLHNINYSAKIIYKNYKSISYKFYIIIILSYFNSIILYSQNDSIFSNLRKIENQKIDSLIYKNSEIEKYKYLALLPNLSYDAINNSFNVGINISNLANYFQTRHRNKLELQKIENDLKNNLDKKIIDLNNEYDNIIILIDNWFIDIEIFENQKKNYIIKNEQYKNNKINLEYYINAEIIYTKNKKNLIFNYKKIKNKITNYQFKIKNC